MSEFSKKQAEEQHKLGKLTAEERIGKIVDAGSFVEIDKYLERSNAVLGYPDVCAPGEGVVAGWATIEAVSYTHLDVYKRQTNSSVDALMAAYLKVLAKVKRLEQKPESVVIYRDHFSVKKQMRVILARLTIKSRVCFEELLSETPSREELAVTFLSLLELLHAEKVSIAQKAAFGEILIEKRGSK